jgi:tetratricopeptide (TPR) repeat protein
MTGLRTRALLNAFLTTNARAAVVRLRNAWSDRNAVFSGFFISDEGHLITAFHAVKAHVFDLPCSFEVTVEFDVTGNEPELVPVTTTAYCEQGWCDATADWVVLKLDLRPRAYLPVDAVPVGPGQGEALCTELRVYGFTTTEQGIACLGGLSGEYLRPVPEKRRFHVAFSVRSRGQSGGPVVSLDSHSVVGSVVGFRQDEQLTGDIAALSHKNLAVLGLDLPGLARQWRVQAANHLCASHPEFASITGRQFIPPLPDRYLAGRGLVQQVSLPLLERSHSVTFLYGPPGSGKTMIAVEAVTSVVEQGVVDSLFWHDFEPPGHRSTQHLLRRLAVHVLQYNGVFDPLDACLAENFPRDMSAVENALVAAISRHRYALVFDNLHFALRDDDGEMTALLTRLTDATRAGDSVAIVTSWDQQFGTTADSVHAIGGMNSSEVRQLVDLHQVSATTDAIDWVSQLAADITCVEAFLRFPAWRHEIETRTPQQTEPRELYQHWLNRFLASAPKTSHRILLALAVLAQPTTRDLLEEIAETSSFMLTLERLQTSPPLVRSDGELFSLHFNVARAILATSDRELIATTHRHAAVAYSKRGDFLSAARHSLDAGEFETALELAFRHRDEIVAKGRVQDLETLADDLRERLGNRAGAAYRLHAVLATCRNIHGEYTEAARHWRFALGGAQANQEMASIHNRRGDSYRLASDYEAARQEYEKAAQLASDQDDEEAHRELGRAQLGLAKIHRLRCSYPLALGNYSDARDSFDAVFDDSGIIEADFGLGEVNRLMERWDKARISYQASLDRAESIRSLERKAYALWGLGEVSRLCSMHTQAHEAHEQGRALCVQVGDTRSEGWALLGLAENARMSGAAGYLAMYREAESKFQLTQSRTEIAHTSLGTAEALRASGEIDEERYELALDT